MNAIKLSRKITIAITATRGRLEDQLRAQLLVPSPTAGVKLTTAGRERLARELARGLIDALQRRFLAHHLPLAPRRGSIPSGGRRGSRSSGWLAGRTKGSWGCRTRCVWGRRLIDTTLPDEALPNAGAARRAIAVRWHWRVLRKAAWGTQRLCRHDRGQCKGHLSDIARSRRSRKQRLPPDTTLESRRSLSRPSQTR